MVVFYLMHLKNSHNLGVGICKGLDERDWGDSDLPYMNSSILFKCFLTVLRRQSIVEL